MHESGLIRELMGEAERRAPEGATITGLTLRIGALAPVSPEALRHGVSTHAASAWNTTLKIAIQIGDSPTDAAALGVELVSLRVET